MIDRNEQQAAEPGKNAEPAASGTERNSGDPARPVLRDPVTGRILPGSAALHPAGRPRGVGTRLRLVTVVRKLMEENGHTLEDAVRHIAVAMLREARNGNTVAAKILLDKLTTSDAEEAALDGRARIEIRTGPPVPASLDEYLHDIEDFAQSFAGHGHTAGSGANLDLLPAPRPADFFVHGEDAAPAPTPAPQPATDGRAADLGRLLS
jgi:hypothetical protein